ncbi:MAG: head GIN domain-containing protein [Caldilineaceae bacterium]
MDRRVLPGLFGLLALWFAACVPTLIYGSGRVVTEQRTVHNFNGVTLSGSGELTILQGDDEALTIEAEDNIMPHISSDVRNGVLLLGFVHKAWFQVLEPTQSIKFTLTVKELTHLTLSGSGSVTAAQLTTDQLAAAISGAGDVAINQLRANHLTAAISGSGSANLAGKVVDQTVDISGNGQYQADNLESQTAKVTISGAGEMTLWVQKQLDADISGSGAVRYYGDPQTNTHSAGSGSFKRLGNK